MRLVDIHKANVVMTQETMDDEVKISRELELRELFNGVIVYEPYGDRVLF